jgi:hypothetical protein
VTHDIKRESFFLPFSQTIVPTKFSAPNTSLAILFEVLKFSIIDRDKDGAIFLKKFSQDEAGSKSSTANRNEIGHSIQVGDQAVSLFIHLI